MMAGRLVYLCLCFSLCSCENITSNMTHMAELNNLQLADNACIVSTRSVLKCAMECASNASCASLSYHRVTRDCLLYPFLLSKDRVGVISEDGWTSYKKSREIQRDCLALFESGVTQSGVYDVSVTGTSTASVWCDMETDGGGWTVFQRRIDGATDFYRGWDEYREGFGDVNNEFWLGNEKLHTLTSEDDNEMRVDMEDFESNMAYAKYQTFVIEDAQEDYRLEISGYSGNEGDSLSYQNGRPFTTKDHGNTYCALTYGGAWWYNGCHSSNLNGLYLFGSTPIYAKGMVWDSWKGQYYSLKDTKMMIRRLAKP